MTRYHPALVALHWIMAIMIVMALIFGNFVVGPMANTDPAKAEILVGHMSVGIIIGSLLVIRLFVRHRTQKPTAASTGNALLDRLAGLTHIALYGLVALMVASGLGMAFGADLFAVVYGGQGAIPEDLSQMGAAMAHGLVSKLLLLLLVLHVVAALYHQFFLRDSLFRRMWFGNRQS